ncbi:MAG: DNA gyrase subunit A [Anaerolineales bacterium]|nr:DNA gyrase subunit A [Anaerolineales bacterium]
MADEIEQPQDNSGNIQSVDIDAQMRTAYLDYAMSVIVSRALPDARDGLKPVHRRILYAMDELGIRSTGSYKKSARIVGEVLGKYHPHGDAAVYETMARMAQDFSLRYLLVDGQGNFGSIDGDSPAAMRYTEARLQKLAEEMLADLDKDTVDFGPNFDDSLEEPLVLPARLPNLLLNGSAGIAVGMATNIPPHNLRELVGAISHLIDHYDHVDDVTVEELMKFVQGPDFPTGGMIIGAEGILSAYSTGRGRIVMRGVAHIEEMKGGRHQINITEIPYQVNKTTLIERIAELVREDRIDMISDMRDESDQRGMSIIIELKRGAQPKKVLNQLYKYTSLQSTFGVIMLALVDGEPRTLPLKRALQIFIEHRQTVIVRRSNFELAKARARLHILDGYLIALNNIDAIIKVIREAEDSDAAKTNLMARFKLSELQAQAILDMQLRRLAALERWKIEEEHKQVKATIDYLEDLLAHPKKILALIKTELTELAEKYGDDRRTRIAAEAKENIHEEDLVADEAVLISLTERGYIKRVAAAAFKSQSRGGRGVMGHSTKDEDEVVMLIPARSLDTMLFFSDKGKVYSEKVYQIPDADRTGKGIPLVNILALGANEKVTAAVAVKHFSADAFCMMMTLHGRIKRVQMDEFASVRPSGLIAISLEEGDTLGWARLTTGKDEIIIVTESGQALRFGEGKVRAMGRQAAGVNGIKLKKDDLVTSMDVVEKEGALLIVTAHGFGKQTPLTEYTAKGRATNGISTVDQKAIKEIGRIVAARVVQKADDLTIMTANGVTIRLKVKDVKQSSRATKGVHLIKPQEGDSVASMARMSAEDLKKAGADISAEAEEAQPKLV